MRPSSSILMGQHGTLSSVSPPPVSAQSNTVALSNADRKVWVGSIPSSATEMDVRCTLGVYGSISELYYKPDPVRGSRGWAFVTYSMADEARSMIGRVNGILSFPDSERPVEARLANQKDVAVKEGGSIPHPPQLPGILVTGTNDWPTPPAPQTSVGSNYTASSSSVAPQRDASSNASNAAVPSTSAAASSVRSSSAKQVPSKRGSQAETGSARAASKALPPCSKVSGATSAPEGPTLWQVYYTPSNIPYYYNNVTSHVQWECPLPPKEYLEATGQSAGAKAPAGRNYGPPGANLFIFHLPSEWNDVDLKQHFNCFGNVVSSRIQTDSTGRNSGFGFVSYDSTASAIAAIRLMNGFGVCGKFLKVQLKKGEEHLLPPDLADLA